MRLTILSLVFLLVSPAYAVNFINERSINFKVDVDKLSDGSVQIASRYADPGELAHFWYSDVDPKSLTKEATGKVYVVKAAYIAKKGSSLYSDPKLFETQNLSKVLPQFEIVQAISANQCVVQTPLPSVPFGLLPSHMRCTLSVHHSAQPHNTPADANLGTPVARTEQECAEFNLLFSASTAVNHYYPLDHDRTLVVNYQTYHVTDSAVEKAESLPFFNLQKKLEGQIKDEMQTFIKNFNGEGQQ